MFHHNFYMLQESSKGFRTCFSIVKGDKKEIYITFVKVVDWEGHSF